MIVNCPSCASRYRIADERIPARGARITCPKCAHKFIVHRETRTHVIGGEAAAPQGLAVTFARQGELTRGSMPVDDNDDDAPTTIMPTNSALAAELRKAIGEDDAQAPATPAAPAVTAPVSAAPPKPPATRSLAVPILVVLIIIVIGLILYRQSG